MTSIRLLAATALVVLLAACGVDGEPETPTRAATSPDAARVSSAR